MAWRPRRTWSSVKQRIRHNREQADPNRTAGGPFFPVLARASCRSMRVVHVGEGSDNSKLWRRLERGERRGDRLERTTWCFGLVVDRMEVSPLRAVEVDGAHVDSRGVLDEETPGGIGIGIQSQGMLHAFFLVRDRPYRPEIDRRCTTVAQAIEKLVGMAGFEPTAP
jgi:hypothetical protein